MRIETTFIQTNSGQVNVLTKEYEKSFTIIYNQAM